MCPKNTSLGYGVPCFVPDFQVRCQSFSFPHQLPTPERLERHLEGDSLCPSLLSWQGRKTMYCRDIMASAGVAISNAYTKLSLLTDCSAPSSSI